MKDRKILSKTLELFYRQEAYETSEEIDVTGMSDEEIKTLRDNWEEDVRSFREGRFEAPIVIKYDWSENGLRRSVKNEK